MYVLSSLLTLFYAEQTKQDQPNHKDIVQLLVLGVNRHSCRNSWQFHGKFMTILAQCLSLLFLGLDCDISATMQVRMALNTSQVLADHGIC